MNGSLSSFLSKLVILQPNHLENLSIFPIIMEKTGQDGEDHKSKKRDFLFLDSQKIGKKKIYFHEPPRLTPCWWEKLNSSNHFRVPVFLPEGILLKGGRQNRILGKSYLLPKRGFFNRTFQVQTYCIERLRSRGKKMDDFQYAGFAPAHIRALGGDNTPHRPEKQKKVWESVSKSLILTGIQLKEDIGSSSSRKRKDSSPDQTGFISLHELQHTLLSMQAQEDSMDHYALKEATSPSRLNRTEDLTALYQDEINSLIISQKIVLFEKRKNQVGMIGVIQSHDKVYVFLDIFPHPQGLELYFQDLTASYIITSHILGAEGGERIKEHAPNGLEITEQLLQGLKKPYFESREKYLLGQPFRVIEKDVEASGHIWQDEIFYLRASNYQTQFREIFLQDGVTFIGRKLPKDKEDVGIHYFEISDPLVSRRHGRFTREKEEIFFEDLGSTNGSEILEDQGFVPIKKKRKIPEGALLRLGDTYLKIRLEPQKPAVLIQEGQEEKGEKEKEDEKKNK